MESLFKTDNYNRSLILAGGGVRLAYHAGVLIALEEAGIGFNHVDGTSGGIFGTAMLASGISPKEAAVRWRNLKLEGFMAAMPPVDYTSQHNLPALGSADGIRKKIFPALGVDPQKINSNTQFKATFNVCNFSKKTIECINGKDINEDYLIAGMSLPVFMPAIKMNGDWYTDAVWIKDANITEAVKAGAEDVWLIWCIGNTHDFLNGIFLQYVHMIEISANGGVFAEIEWLRSFNSNGIKKGMQAVSLHIIKPRYPLPLDPDFLYNKINADTLINMGYADTRQYLATGKPFADDEAVFTSTAMTTVAVSLHFRQQFRGKIIMDGSLTAVSLQLSFFIRDVGDRFVFQLFSSVSVNGGDFISAYNNNLEIVGGGKVEAGFQFYCNGVSYSASIKMYLHSVVDMLIGIDNKTALVAVSSDRADGPEAILIQSAINRIKNAFYMNVNADTGWYKKLKLKSKLLLKLFNPAI